MFIDLLLVAEPAQHRPPIRLILLTLDSARSAAIDYPNHAARIAISSDDYPHVISGRAENRAYLRDRFHLVQDVYRKGVAEHDHENMACPDRMRRRNRGGLELFICPSVPDEARSRGFAEGDAEFHARNRSYHGFVKILDRFDEVSLADNHVRIGGTDNFNRAEFHSDLFSAIHLLVGGCSMI